MRRKLMSLQVPSANWILLFFPIFVMTLSAQPSLVVVGKAAIPIMKSAENPNGEEAWNIDTVHTFWHPHRDAAPQDGIPLTVTVYPVTVAVNIDNFAPTAAQQKDLDETPPHIKKIVR